MRSTDESILISIDGGLKFKFKVHHPAISFSSPTVESPLGWSVAWTRLREMANVVWLLKTLLLKGRPARCASATSSAKTPSRP